MEQEGQKPETGHILHIRGIFFTLEELLKL